MCIDSNLKILLYEVNNSVYLFFLFTFLFCHSIEKSRICSMLLFFIVGHYERILIMKQNFYFLKCLKNKVQMEVSEIVLVCLHTFNNYVLRICKFVEYTTTKNTEKKRKT